MTKKKTIGKIVKKAINEMEIVARRNHHSSSEYFAPLEVAWDMVDRLMDHDPQRIFYSDWGTAFVCACFEHTMNIIAHDSAQFGNPDWTEEDVQEAFDNLARLDIYDFSDFLKMWRYYREVSFALPGHTHVKEVFSSIQRGEDRRQLGMRIEG